MTTECRKIVYGGRVQGVGFRMTARRIASDFLVSGFVRNQADGRVEVVVEGEPGAVTSFLLSLRTEFGDMIRDVDEHSCPKECGDFTGFTIRY